MSTINIKCLSPNTIDAVNLDTGQLKLSNISNESQLHLRLNADEAESLRSSTDLDLDSFAKFKENTKTVSKPGGFNIPFVDRDRPNTTDSMFSQMNSNHQIEFNTIDTPRFLHNNNQINNTYSDRKS